MMKSKIVIVLLMSVWFCRNAFAYMDPGTGSYIVQLIVAGIATAVLSIRSVWSAVLAPFRRLFKKKK